MGAGRVSAPPPVDLGPTTLSKTLLGFGANLTDSIKKAKTQLEATFKSKDVVMLSLTRWVDVKASDFGDQLLPFSSQPKGEINILVFLDIAQNL